LKAVLATAKQPQAKRVSVPAPAFGERCVLTEADLTHAIVDTLNNIPGVWCWRQNTGRRGGVSFGLRGQADITGVVDGGRRIELEVKLPGGKVEPHQVAFIERMRMLGAIAGVVRSMDDAIALVAADRKITITDHPSFSCMFPDRAK
jgi:hypothetical protein